MRSTAWRSSWAATRTMSSPAPRAPRASLARTVLRVAAIATVAAAVVWSVLFVDVVRKRVEVGAALPALEDGQSSQAPAPVTTRTS